MAMTFTKEYPLTTGESDRYDRLSPVAILDISQDMAGKHADELHIGFKDVFPKGIIWIVARVKYEVLEYPECTDDVVVNTWPKVPSRVDMDREIEFKSKEGKKQLIKVIQKWVLWNYKENKMLFPSAVDLQGEFNQDVLFTDKFRPLTSFKLENKVYSFQVKPSQIDHNMHMNNTKYAEEILNAVRLKEDEVIKTFEINYIKQCMLDDKLEVYVDKQDKDIRVEISNGEEVVCRAQITLF